VVSKASKIIEENTVTKDEYNKLKNRIESIIGSEIDNHKLDILRNVFSETAQLSVLNWQCRMIKLLKGGFAPEAESELLVQESIPQSKYKSFLNTLIENGLVEDRKIQAYYITAEGEWIFNYINDPTILKGRIENEIKKEKNYQSHIQENLDLFKRYDTKFCIALLDIDDFKNINDTYGHVNGDRVLKIMSKNIKDIIRKTDTIFRIGGEEFIIIFTNTKLEDAYIVSEKIRPEVASTEIIKDKKITISIGVSEFKKDDDTNSIFERIDKLLYKSKQDGKNRISFI
ncbi:MAG: GGDEF domain-containing protein, partial [Campylobacteraceae bacterium]|nr:GGDEF domain-containing protein [Campylobacteraceae bacterium]